MISGDMFDSKKATIKTMDRVFNSIKNCPNVDFLYLSGNHDALTINEDEYVFPDNFKLFQNEWTSFSYENVNIIGAYFDKYNSKTLFDTISLDKTLINILVMHGQIAGYKSNEDAEIISLPKLAEKGVDYLALGHIHEYSIGSIDKRGVYAYSGTLEGRGFDELGKKGFIEISVENCTLNHKFVEFSSRENYQVDFDISSYTNIHDVIEGIKENLTENYGENNLFKVVLKANIFLICQLIQIIL